MSSFMEGLSTIALAIIGLAIVAVIVSKNSNAAGVIQAGASGLGNDIGVAISPVTGSNPSISLAYPTTSGFGGFGS